MVDLLYGHDFEYCGSHLTIVGFLYFSYYIEERSQDVGPVFRSGIGKLVKLVFN
jgi:hypothetical protein